MQTAIPRISWAVALCLAVLVVATPAVAEWDIVFSTSSDQWTDDLEAGKLVHQALYASTDGISEAMDPFVPAYLGLDAVDIQGDGSVFFSVVTSGVVLQSTGPFHLAHERLYRYDPDTGVIAEYPSWEEWGISIEGLDALDCLVDGSLAFSTHGIRWISHAGGNGLIYPENVYRFDPASGMVELVFDGRGLGLPDLDATHVMEGGHVAFSTATNVWVMTASGGKYLEHEDVYLWENGDLTMVLDGSEQGLYSVDAVTLGRFWVSVDREEIVFHSIADAVGFDVVSGDLTVLRGTVGALRERAFYSRGPPTDDVPDIDMEVDSYALSQGNPGGV